MHSNLTGTEVLGYRSRLGLTQERMAKLVGVSLRTWTRWELGTHAVPETAAKLLAKIEEGR